MQPAGNCVVVFDYTQWITYYPQFAATVTQQIADSLFYRLTVGGLLDNTPESIMTDLAQRQVILYLGVAHLAQLGGYLNAAQGQVVGRVSAATQGSVNVTLDFESKGGANAAWWNQTPFGAQVYAMTLSFRTGFYVGPPSRIPTIPIFGRFGGGLRRF